MKACRVCPRACLVDRTAGDLGVCGMPDVYRVARIAPHLWEEPPISGEKGSGTVFFSGCNLRCVFCQNRDISREGIGDLMAEDALVERIHELLNQGVHNLNLVTPTHYTPMLARLLERLKPILTVPVVWNSSGYETVESLRMLEGLVDVYLPDFKYISPELSAAYSAAPDYAEVATRAVLEMYRQTGEYEEKNGLAVKGVLIRHLVLPGCRADSMAVMKHLASILPPADIRVSVMRQYTPDFARDCPHRNLHRRVTEFEYSSVLEETARLGLMGFSQGKEAASKAFTPNFKKK
ncbi:MAG: radical SAM protein [Clostridia bacterium]|nr:radical SAM protein [Clostridia bacterium]